MTTANPPSEGVSLSSLARAFLSTCLLSLSLFSVSSNAFLHSKTAPVTFVRTFDSPPGAPAAVGTTNAKSPVVAFQDSFRLHASVKSKQSTSSKRKKNKKSGSSTTAEKKGLGRPVSREEVSDHVSTRYNQGQGGPLGEKGRLRGLPKRMRASVDADECDAATASGEGGLWDEKQEEYLKMLNGRPALVLNADYMPLSYLPLSLWSWQDAVKAVFGGKVAVVDVYPEITVRAANIEVPLPSIIALTDYVQQKNQKPAFTRRNVFLRDEYRCQYCNNHFHTADLSLDHVIPRSKGGELSWDNAVTSCLKCNGKKGSTSVAGLKSIGMKLLREPRCPSQMELASRAARMVPKRVHPTWKPYLGIAERPPSSGKTDGDEDFIDDRYFETEA